jgi:hypothetical protein
MITLKTLADATPQQVFDQIATHLIKQNSRCSLAKSDDLCRYREGDLKCAAGCLISNDEYSQDMETKTWWSLIDKGMVPINSHTSLISRLQQMHDDLDVEDWGSVLKEIADEFELNTDVLN